MRIELIAEIDGQKVKGLSQMKALADKGNIEALNLLGEWMMMGFECSPDPDFYVSCFKEAANKGNTQGMLNLAVCYMEERGVPADFYAAERWIRAAIEGGDREGIELFKELYLTTIGNHKPDVRAYVRTMKAFDPSGSYLGERVGGFERFWMSEEELEQRLMANLVLGSRGKSVKEIRKIKNKLTDADIEGYARLQDIHHDETEAVAVKRDYVAEKAKALSNFRGFIPNADREQLFIAVRAVHKLVPDTKVNKGEAAKSKFGGKVIGLAQRSKMVKSEDIQGVLDILYSSLNWRTKATFDLDDELFNKFEDFEVSELLNLISAELDRIENYEIQSRFDNSSKNWKALKVLITEIKKIEYYSSDIITQWVSHITEQITELQDQEINNRFNRSQNDYFAVVELYNFANGSEATVPVKKAWASKLHEVAVALQHSELEKLCSDLEGKQLNGLYHIETQAAKYAFDKKTLSLYQARISEFIETAQNKNLADKLNNALSDYDALVALHANVTTSTEYHATVKATWREQIAEAIKTVQEKDLAQMLSAIDALDYAELIMLYQKAQHYSFNKDVLSAAIKPLDDLIDKKEQTHLAELCNGIESYSPSRLKVLEDKIVALHYRDKNTKKPIAQIRGLVKYNGVLEKCTPSRLVNYEPDQLDELMKEVHFSSLPKEEKERIFALIAQQREANENFDAEVAQVVADCKSELLKFVKAEFSTLEEILCVFPDDSTMQAQTKHIDRTEWSDDEFPLVYVNKGSRLDCLLTNKAIRGNDSFVTLSVYDTLKIRGDSCNLVIQKTADGTNTLAWGNSEAWDKPKAEKIAFAFNRSVRKIKEISAFQQSKIRTMKNQHQYDSTMLGNDGGSVFTSFAQRYSPYSIIDFSAEQVEESKEAVQESPLSSVEKKAILHILNDAERYKQQASDAVETYDKNFLALSCKGVREIAKKYLGIVPPMIYNDSPADFRRGIDSIKAQYKDSPVHKADYDDLLKNGICILMCGGRGAGKGAFLIFKRYELYYFAAADVHGSTGWGILQYANITKIMYNRVGFTHAPEIAIFVKDDSRHYNGVSVTGQPAETVEKMATLCREVVDYLGDEIIIRKDNAREDDRKAIATYFEKARKDLTAYYTEAWESIILASGSLTQAQFSEYLNKCIEYEIQYYEAHPLKLSYDYYTIKKPRRYTGKQANTTSQNVSVQKPATPADIKQIAIKDKVQLKRMADQLGIAHVLDFDNVDIQTFLNNNPGYADSGTVVKAGEYGIVLLKNLPEPLLLTNTAYYTALSHFGKTDLYHSNPLITGIPFNKYKVVSSKVFKTNALKYDYRETINGVTPHMEGEIPSNLDKDTLERVLQFLNYAAYGTQPTISEKPTTPQVATTTNTQTSGFADLIQKGLGHLQRNLSELKDSEVGEAMLALTLKHSTRGYLAVGTESFNSKIGKAKAAYAKVPIGERVLVMADDTIFGSAKEGFVLTDKHIYINISGCKNKCIAIADITSVYSTRRTGFTYIMVSAPSGNYCMSCRSVIADGEACKNFLYELIHYLNPNCLLGNGAPVGNVPTAPVTPTPAQTVASPGSTPNVSKWQCNCGNINSGKFCSKCGSKKEDGTPLWTCSCGSVNDGKFCPKCGSPKKEE
ncbi:MAG: hypothetical protein II897_01695 [Clostridia bacterium]|nr:hypothetical protein [Clostridia bacterium]